MHASDGHLAPAFDNFHTDDIVEYLGTPRRIPPDAQASSFGTLLVTFNNVPSTFGWEGTVTARTYNPVSLANGLSGTVAIAYPGSLFFESANTTLVATIRDTRPVSPTPAAGALRTNLGITNTDLNGVGPVDIDLSFFDVTEGSATNGQRVGNILAVDGLQPGEVRQINNVWAVAGDPGGRHLRHRVRRHRRTRRRASRRSRATSTSSTAARRTARTSR